MSTHPYGYDEDPFSSFRFIWGDFDDIGKLFEDLRTAKLVFAYFRTIFQALSLALAYHPDSLPLSKKFKALDKSLGNAKFVIGIFEIPLKIHSTSRAAKKTYQYSYQLFTKLKNGEPVDLYLVMKNVSYGAKTVSKTISLINRVVVKPLSFVSYQFDFEESLNGVFYCWSYVSLTGKVFKVIHISCEIIEGEDVVWNVIELAFQVSDCVLKGVKLAGWKVHPAISLTLAIGEGLLKVVKVMKDIGKEG